MKIAEITYKHIKFDNGSKITFNHVQHCCEENYADFEQIEEQALETVFDENLVFEAIEGYGFRFGSKGTPMFFIPCYSDQNGHYSSDIDIYYNGRPVLNLECKRRNSSWWLSGG